MANKKKEVANEEVSVIIRPDLEKYVAGKSASGKKTHHTGDLVATTIDGMTVAEVEDIAAAIVPDFVAGKYAHLNVGMQRMNTGNRIRAVAAKLEKEVDGSGTAAFEKAAKASVKARDARVTEAAKAAEIAAKEAATAKAEAKPAKKKKEAAKKEAA